MAMDLTEHNPPSFTCTRRKGKESRDAPDLHGELTGQQVDSLGDCSNAIIQFRQALEGRRTENARVRQVPSTPVTTA
jgi:hypothetical protein